MGDEELFQAKLVSSHTDEKKPVAEELSGVPMFVAKPGIKYLGVSDRDLFQLMIQGFLYCGGRGYHGKYIGSAFRFLPPKRASKWLHSQLEQDCKPVLIELEQTLPTKTSIVGCHEVRCAHFCSEGDRTSFQSTWLTGSNHVHQLVELEAWTPDPKVKAGVEPAPEPEESSELVEETYRLLELLGGSVFGLLNNSGKAALAPEVVSYLFEAIHETESLAGKKSTRPSEIWNRVYCEIDRSIQGEVRETAGRADFLEAFAQCAASHHKTRLGPGQFLNLAGEVLGNRDENTVFLTLQGVVSGPGSKPAEKYKDLPGKDLVLRSLAFLFQDMDLDRMSDLLEVEPGARPGSLVHAFALVLCGAVKGLSSAAKDRISREAMMKVSENLVTLAISILGERKGKRKTGLLFKCDVRTGESGALKVYLGDALVHEAKQTVAPELAFMLEKLSKPESGPELEPRITGPFNFVYSLPEREGSEWVVAFSPLDLTENQFRVSKEWSPTGKESPKWKAPNLVNLSEYFANPVMGVTVIPNGVDKKSKGSVSCTLEVRYVSPTANNLENAIRLIEEAEAGLNSSEWK